MRGSALQRIFQANPSTESESKLVLGLDKGSGHLSKAVKISTYANLADELTTPLAPHTKRKLDLVHRSKYALLIAPSGGKKVRQL